MEIFDVADVFSEIISYLKTWERARVAQVCKKWRGLVYSRCFRSIDFDGLKFYKPQQVTNEMAQKICYPYLEYVDFSGCRKISGISKLGIYQR